MKTNDIICFSNGYIYRPSGFVSANLYVQNGKIIAPQKADRHIDCQEGFVAPGLIDLQVNGIGDIDFAQGLDRLDAAALHLAKQGVTSFLATIISKPLEQYLDCVTSFRQEGAQCLGIHLEGPYLHPARFGAHAKEYLATEWSSAYWDVLCKSAKIKMLTLAPELKNMQAFIDFLNRQGVVVFAGHTNATSEELQNISGLKGVTHLFNAMRPFHQRDPGAIGYVLGQRKLLYSLIVDGMHLHKDSVLMAYNAHPEGLLLVSDMRAKTLGGKEITGELQASAQGLLHDVKTFCWHTQIPLHQAIEAASTRQARLLGVSKGLLDPGYDADIIILDKSYQLQAAFVAGKEIFS